MRKNNLYVTEIIDAYCCNRELCGQAAHPMKVIDSTVCPRCNKGILELKVGVYLVEQIDENNLRYLEFIPLKNYNKDDIYKGKKPSGLIL